MYNIREKVSDDAGRRFRVFRVNRDLTNSEALQLIFESLPAISNKIDEQRNIASCEKDD